MFCGATRYHSHLPGGRDNRTPVGIRCASARWTAACGQPRRAGTSRLVCASRSTPGPAGVEPDGSPFP